MNERYDKERKVLITSTIPSTIGQFNRDNINILQELGYKVHIAANFKDTNIWDKEQTDHFRKDMRGNQVKCIQIDFSRSPLSIKSHIKSYKRLNYLLKKENYSFIHTHTPIASALVRIAACRQDIKTIYTAHGFHFFKGASIKNWLLYYPVEWLLSFYTEILVTINKEDYWRARKHLHAKRTVYIPGAGVKTDKFLSYGKDKKGKRDELGLSIEDFVIVSVGELNANKNHRVVMEALAKIEYQDIKYVICGEGSKKEELKSLARRLGLEARVFILGYRQDINEILHMSDIFAFPSRREGLGLAAIEAMAAGLPLVTSNIHGINDYSVNEKSGYSCRPDDSDGFAHAITCLYHDPHKRAKMGMYNKKRATKFDIENVSMIMKEIYRFAADG